MSTTPICSPLLRACLIVGNLERSIRFYKTLLDFSERFSFGDGRSDVVASLLGRPAGTRTRFEILKQPGPNFGMLGLFELSEPAPPSLHASSPSVSIGESVLVFYHHRLDWLLNELPAYGGAPVAGPHWVTTPQITFREAVVGDPDGFKLVLMDRDPLDANRTVGPGRTLS